MSVSVHPSDLTRVLDGADPEIGVLSLDCFDTLLWRATHAPRDVFADLADVGVTAHARILAEEAARHRAAAEGREEVDLAEIYAALAPLSTAEQRDRLIAAELEAEAAHCFAFPPTVELIRAAHAAGKRIVVVSDTYLRPEQLTALIGAAAGEDVLGMIERVFCSCAYGRSKAGGLFPHVLAELGVPPEAVLHVGDNPFADLQPPQALGMQAVHLQQFDADTGHRLRLEAAVAPVLRGRARLDRAVVQPHRAAAALGGREGESAAAALGRTVLGPVMQAFTEWLEAERQALQARTAGQVKLLFLMRDGFLPLRAYRARFGEGAEAHAVYISRFTATAAALSDAREVARCVADMVSEHDPEVMGAQLLLRPGEVTELAGAGPREHRRARFLEKVARPATSARITARSQRFCERLVAHVRAVADPRPGDALMLIDLGYNGTVQNWVEPLLRRSLGVEVCGRYLVSRPRHVTPFDKAGLFDAALLDEATLGALCRHIAVIEQLCTTDGGSVIDYRDGEPLLRSNSIAPAQQGVRAVVQAAAVEHVRAAPSLPRPRLHRPDDERIAAAAVMGRLLFFPLKAELEALAEFQHDINLNTSQTRPLFDPALGAEQLREQGLFYLNNAKRMYLPAEIRSQGLPLSMTLFTNARFGLDLKHADFHPEPVLLPVMIASDGRVDLHELPAHATHDGYLRCVIPVGDRRFTAGLLFGRLYEWVQLDSLRFERADEATAFSETSRKAGAVPADAVGEGVASPAPGLLQMESEAAFVLAPPPPRTDDSDWVLTAVFRPLVMRTAAVAAPAAAPVSAAA